MMNPFKPGSGLYPPYFAGREREINIFKDKLKQTVAGTPMHMSIIGDWASGKTSLLEELKRITEANNCFVCETIASNTDSPSIFINNLSKSIADRLQLKHGFSLVDKIKGKLKETKGFQISAFGFGGGIQKKDEESPQFDLRFGLRTVWKDIKNNYKAMVLLIDDFDTITENKNKRKQIMLTLRNGLMEAINDGVNVPGVTP